MLNNIKCRNAAKNIFIVLSCIIGFKLHAQNKPLPFNPNGKFIFLYTEPNFKGKQLAIDINAYTEMDLTVQKLWNNTISSMQVPNGVSVSFCDVDESKGNKVELGNGIFKTYQIANFKKLPIYNLLKWNGTDWNEIYKKQIIDFDNKLSYITVFKKPE